MNLYAKNLLIEMREYTKNQIQNDDLPAFIPSAEELEKLYNEASHIDISSYEGNDDINALEKMITDESLDYSNKSKALIEDSAKEVEKIDVTSTEKQKQDVIDRLNHDRQKSKDLAEETIDNVYDKLIKAVEKEPGLGDIIIKLAEIFLNGFRAVINSIIAFIQEIINTLVAIAKTIWEAIKTIFKEIVEGILRWFVRSTPVV